MDSLYYNAPRPFNKYPTGYRPMNGGGGPSPLRQFGSMTSLSQYPQPELSPPTLHNNNSTSFVSIPDTNLNQRPTNISYRAGSVGPYGEPTFLGSGFSSRDPSPPRSNNHAYSQEVPRNIENSPYNQRSPMNGNAGDDFLTKLRRQKEDIERAFSRPEYNYPEPAPVRREPAQPTNNSFQPHFNDVQSSNSYWNPESSAQLHKTRSDSHVVRDRIIPVSSNDNRMFNNSMNRSMNVDSSYGNAPVGTNGSQKNGFFRRSLVEPDWMTIPPPPIDIQPRSNGIARSDDQRATSYIDRNSYCEPSDNGSHVIPIKLDNDRILKIYPDQPVNRDPPRQVTAPLTIKTMSPPSYLENQPFSNSFHRERGRTNSYSRREDDFQPMAAYESRNSHTMPMSRQRQASPPVPVQSSHAMRQSQMSPPVADRVQFQQPQNNGRHYNSFQREERPNVDFYDVKQNFREELLSVIPQKTRQSPFVNRPVHLRENEDDALFSPVASKVYQGHNRINGFIHDKPSAGSFQPTVRGQVGSPPAVSRERSFAVVSRPQTPPATLEPARQFSPPAELAHARDFSPPSRTPQFGRREFSPLAFSPERRVFSPVSSNLSPTESLPTSRSQMSPISSLYDNDSETEMMKMSMRGRKPHHLSPPPQGILLKNTDAPRPAKKVVFQCDRDTMDRLMRDMRMVPSPVDAPPHVRDFDAAIEDSLAQFASLSDQIGGDVVLMKAKVMSTFDALRSFLWSAAGRVEASGDEVQKLVSPIVKQLEEINIFKDSKRNTPQFNHLSAVAEGIPAVGWVLVKKTPAPYVKEMTDAAMFYVNRILKEFKDTDPKHVEWVKTWKELLESMQKYVRQTHTTGLVWNSAPGSAPSGAPAAARSGPPPPPAGGAPPPPPPPPSDLMAGISKPSSGGDKAGRDALFAELNKGEGVTAGLRKVTSDMQTHKNPTLRATAPVPSASTGRNAPGAAAIAVKKPPKIELQDGKQWNVEFQVGNKNVVVEITDKKQTVYVYKCENSVIQVKGKLNSITLDGCKKTSIVFDAVVAQCETINCQSVQIQTLGEMRTLSIQKTDGCQVYLSEEAKNTEIVTSKSSEMNILVPEGPDGDFTEFPVPEQFKTVYKGGKLVTSASDII